MKKITLIISLAVSAFLSGAHLKDIPVTITQPDGTEINLFASGDEFFNRLHDVNDFTVIQHDDGWYYYGVRSGDEVVPSSIRLNDADPARSGLTPGAVISSELYKKRVASFNNHQVPKEKDAPTTGTINNLCVFIRFSDESESIFNRQRSYYDTYFNKPDGPSLGHYFNEVSYEKLTVNSVYYPHVDDFSTNLSYQDIYPRSYYKPYNATTNPDGYSNDSERTEREHSLLERAVLAIAGEVPTDLVIDSDRDGFVDNIVFLISGAPGAWASLLWPHRWALYTKNISINRKRVWDYNFNLTGTTTYFTVGVIAHEFFHSLGAPDLYHYYNDTAPDAVGAWDVMNSTSNPPQYMGAWMKYKYGKWIDSVPVISAPGVYSLKPLQSETGNIFRINSPNSLNEFFVVEYRMQTGLYEASLPGSDNGILIYRINSSYEGNADGPPDEVYIFRPGGTLTAGGTLNSALFSKALGRTEFNQLTNPYPFLSNGNAGGINIVNIGYAGSEISFELSINVQPPKNLITACGYGKIELNWTAPDAQQGVTLSHYRVYRNSELIADNLLAVSYTDETVADNDTYTYSISAFYTGAVNGESSLLTAAPATYNPPASLPYYTSFDSQDRWTQQETGGASPRWTTSSSSNAGGAAPEMMAEMENVENATSRLISPAFSTSGTDTVLISFRQFYDAYETGLAYKVLVSPNKSDWTETGWSFAGDYSDNGPSLETIELTEFPDPMYVAFTLEGYLWNYDGWYIDDLTVSKKGTTSVQDTNIPSVTKLYGNYPNPFNPSTTIRFSLSEVSDIKLNIYDLKGSLVITLAEGKFLPGEYSLMWNGSDKNNSQLPSGLYYISLTSGGRTFIHKSLLVK